MKPADILRMIENVSPDDAGKMDEIDARVAEYLHGLDKVVIGTPPPYTRSRNALKGIRTNWWYPRVDITPNGNYYASMVDKSVKIRHTEFNTPFLPTEELAELHAIIQAIAYERGGE